MRLVCTGLVLTLGVACSAQPEELPESIFHARYSPDGGRIVFYSYQDGDAEIYVMDGDGSNLTQLTHNETYDIEPIWSADGSRIAYTASPDMESFTTRVVDADGSNDSRVTAGGVKSWSPDGRRMSVVWTEDEGQTFSSEIYDIESGERDEIAHPAAARAMAIWSPDWSRIAWVDQGDLYVAEIDDVLTSRLTEGFDVAHATWSPNGGLIAFVSAHEGDYELYVVDIDRGEPAQLTDNEAQDWFPSWTPDGSIVFSTNRLEGETVLYEIDADGTDEEPLFDPDA